MCLPTKVSGQYILITFSYITSVPRDQAGRSNRAAATRVMERRTFIKKSERGRDGKVNGREDLSSMVNERARRRQIYGESGVPVQQ